MLRANDTIELYKVYLADGEGSLKFVCKYESHCFKISKMIVVRKPGTVLDMLVIQLPSLKFVTLEMDLEVLEFKILCMHNFENQRNLKSSGKINPRQGFLQPFFLSAPDIGEDAREVNHGVRGRPRKDRPVDPNDEKFS